jgi:hypothetical protein
VFGPAVAPADRTPGVRTGRLPADGVLTGSVAADGVLTEGVGTVVAGTVTDGTVTEGTVTDGTVTDGVVSDGVVSDGAFNDGNPRKEAAACPARGSDDSAPRSRAMIPNPLQKLRLISTVTTLREETCANLT